MSARARPGRGRAPTGAALLGAALALGVLAVGTLRANDDRDSVYKPPLATPELVEPFLKHLAPGSDSFPREREAAEIQARLLALGASMRKAGGRLDPEFLAEGFRGGRLLPTDEGPAGPPRALEVHRGPAPDAQPVFDARGFGGEWRRLTAGFRSLDVAELLVTSLEGPGPDGLAVTDVRYDLVGPGREGGRAQTTGEWRMKWRHVATQWRVASWTSRSNVASHARTPVFVETSGSALGGNDSYRRQLGISLDAWSATFDSVLTRDSNGHHGVSVGDADGDGLDDLYVAQPAGLPNRLYRSRGDGTFEDVTDASGLAVLDDTAQSLFADVENDGDQDLVLATGTRPLLFLNDGQGRFAPAPDAFRFQGQLQGSLTSMAMADYDRDGFLDLYLCVYSYFIGAGEDKAGTPMPYHDARNGPPGVLFRNDGRGRFVEVTEEAGLGAGNDRYHFAAAWADYDSDGWVDLLVANDFGTKNLYRNLGPRDGKVVFEDVAAAAGVLDHGAGMSAAFLDYDNDGLLDILTGNMWSENGLRVTADPAFMPDAPAEVRALYRRHARGNSLFRNLGQGRFEDVSLAARVEMGRWAWSTDALDFDRDGFDDIYVANGMLTRETGPEDLDGFFWRQVVARSPLTRVTGTPYDDAWRAINQLLIHRSIASRQRNVFLRNDGKGGFDDVSGAVGLDLDQDGRSFALLDLDRDGDPDLAVMAARQAPQLRLFRNDFAEPGASLSLLLQGAGPHAERAGAQDASRWASNRDAVGARVTVVTDTLQRTRVVHAGSGFLSQHSRELLFGLGPSRSVRSLKVEWPSGRVQTFADVPLGRRFRLVEGGELTSEPFAPARTAAPATPASLRPAAPPDATWLFEPFPAPDFSLEDLQGTARSLNALLGKPALLLLWTSGAPASREALTAVDRGQAALARAGVSALALALDEPQDLTKVRAAASGLSLPVATASKDVALSYAILNRHIFMNRPDLRLPTGFLLDGAGRVVKAYRRRLDVAEVVADAARIQASTAERLSRAVPFPGTLHAPPGLRNYLPYGHELMDQGLEAAAVVAFERAAQASPTAFTLYRLGTLLAKSGQSKKAEEAFERALGLQPDFSEAENDLGALLAQAGNLAGAIVRFQSALRSTPDYPDALNNLGYALLLRGQEAEAREHYERALRLQPDFPEALNNLGLLFGRGGDLDRAEPYFRDALSRRPDYEEAVNNLALILVARGRPEAAVELLQAFSKEHPSREGPYLTLAKIHLGAGRREEGLAALEQLLQRNPNHAQAREILKLVQ